MVSRVKRYFLEIKDFSSTIDLNLMENYKIILDDEKNFQLNKFFYKSIGKNCDWVDRLVWTELDWTKYISDEKLSTYILKYKDEIAGYFELLFNKDTKEAEIVYFGILEEYFGKKLGGYLLSEAIKFSFNLGCIRVWVHTCSLDHKNAIQNYQSRGMKIFKSEILII